MDKYITWDIMLDMIQGARLDEKTQQNSKKLNRKKIKEDNHEIDSSRESEKKTEDDDHISPRFVDFFGGDFACILLDFYWIFGVATKTEFLFYNFLVYGDRQSNHTKPESQIISKSTNTTITNTPLIFILYLYFIVHYY